MSLFGAITTDVEFAARVLNDGGVIGMPTETVYGLAARADIESSVNRIFDIKGRPRNHPLIAHLSLAKIAHKYGQLNDHAHVLADAFWPGPLTLLVRRTGLIGDWVTGGRDTVALRVPGHVLALELLQLVDAPVVAPSANRFGKVSPTTAHHVQSDLGSVVDCILDGGACAVGIESTIIECIDGSVSILRPGAISMEQIVRVTGLAPSLANGESRAPGMMVSHYAPNAHLVIVSSEDEAREYALQSGLESHMWKLLSYSDSDEYALRMYDDLRQCDLQNIPHVIAVKPASDAMGMAVLDRLMKAAAPRPSAP